MNPVFNSKDVYSLLRRHLRPLIGVAILGALAGVILSSSFVITPLFKSNAVVYPVNLVPYGEESSTEQLLQLLLSSEVRNKVIAKHKLDLHYRAKMNKGAPGNLLIREYNDHVKINKTEYESAEIEVLDKDPALAAAIINTILVETNLHARNLHREKSKEMLVMYKTQLIRQQHESDSLEARLLVLRDSFGVTDFERQAKEVTDKYLGMIKAGKRVPEIERIYHNFNKYGGEYMLLRDKQRVSWTYYQKIKTGYDDVSADLAKELSYLNVVTKPYAADTKSYPIRWLIVLTSMLAGLSVAIVWLLVRDAMRQNQV